MQYTKKVMDHFLHPRHSKKMKNADGVGQVGNPSCILPHQKIHVNEDLIPIKDLSGDHKTLGHNGFYNKITSKFRRKYKGKVIILKNKLGYLSLTEDHLVLAVKVPKKREYFDYVVKKGLIPAWYHANDLEPRDIVLYPILKETKDMGYIELDIPKSKWDFKSKPLPQKIPLNNGFLRLCGYFLAEGHIREGRSRNFIALSFNISEDKYINDVKNIVKNLFNLKVSIKRKEYNKTAVVYIYSAILARFFKKLFNKGAKNKSIPHFLMVLPVAKQRALLEGLWKGDGYINVKKKYPRAGYSTISYKLVQQIKILLLRQNIVPSLYLEDEKIREGVSHEKSYRIHIGDKESLRKLITILRFKQFKYTLKEKTHSWFDNNYFYTPITDISTYNYNGEVYNLEVENAHSYTSNAFCVHNCGDIMEVFLKVGKNKKGEDIIKDISFNTFGCAAAISSSDILCELAKGKTIQEAEKITNKSINDYLGGLPQIKVHCSVLGEQALKKAIQNYKDKNSKISPSLSSPRKN